MKFVKVGTLLTSLDMKGVSLSLLKVEDLDWVKWVKADGGVGNW